MSRPTYRRFWRTAYVEQEASYRTILGWDVYGNWERNAMPDGTAEGELIVALRLKYSGIPEAPASAFLERSLSVVERTLREDKLSSARCQGGFPLNRGRLLRTKAYASVLLGSSFNAEALRQASSDHQSWVEAGQARSWDSQAEAYYLAAIRLALVEGDGERARLLVAGRKSLKWHKQEYAVLKALSARPPGAFTGEQELLQELDAYFDEVREPGYQPKVFIESFILPFELALLRDKYFEAAGGSVNISRVLEEVSR
jgi:hypothetical protein